MGQWRAGAGYDSGARLGRSSRSATCIWWCAVTTRDLSTLSLIEIRSLRSELQNHEDAISFVRRLAQGRLDLARDEQRRRADNTPTSTSVEKDIVGIFGQEHGGGSARPPRETNVSADHELVRELEKLSEQTGFGSLRTLDDESLNHAVEVLSEFENKRSTERKQLFDQIDAVTTELVRRYKDSGDNIDSLFKD